MTAPASPDTTPSSAARLRLRLAIRPLSARRCCAVPSEPTLKFRGAAMAPHAGRRRRNRERALLAAAHAQYAGALAPSPITARRRPNSRASATVAPLLAAARPRRCTARRRRPATAAAWLRLAVATADDAHDGLRRRRTRRRRAAPRAGRQRCGAARHAAAPPRQGARRRRRTLAARARPGQRRGVPPPRTLRPARRHARDRRGDARGAEVQGGGGGGGGGGGSAVELSHVLQLQGRLAEAAAVAAAAWPRCSSTAAVPDVLAAPPLAGYDRGTRSLMPRWPFASDLPRRASSPRGDDMTLPRDRRRLRHHCRSRRHWDARRTPPPGCGGVPAARARRCVMVGVQAHRRVAGAAGRRRRSRPKAPRRRCLRRSTLRAAGAGVGGASSGDDWWRRRGGGGEVGRGGGRGGRSGGARRTRRRCAATATC